MVLADDVVLARDYVAGVGNHKWNKPELQAAAAAMAWIIRELPGSPMMIKAMVDVLGKDPANGLDKATALLRAQQGLHGDLGAGPDGSGDLLSSTQKPGGTSMSWADISASQIPSAQGDGSSISSRKHRGGDDSNVDSSGKVSGNSSISDHSLAAPVQLPRGPHDGVAVGGGGEVVDAVANGAGVARVNGVGVVGVVGDERADRRAGEASLHRMQARRPRVCNRIWKGKDCHRVGSGCPHSHPTICGDDDCANGPRPNCHSFHPPAAGRGNGMGGARKGGAASNRHKPRPNKEKAESNSSSRGKNRASRGGGNSGGGSSSSNNNGRPTYSQLQERVAMLKLQISKEKGIRKELKEIREMTSGGTTIDVNNSTYRDVASRGVSGSEVYARAQVSPDFLNAVVAAVVAVLGDKGMAGPRPCRC